MTPKPPADPRSEAGLPPKVSVCIVCYNQREYIGKCIDSILAQECGFGFEVIVGDDASTDGTADIVRQYEKANPGKVRALCHGKNQGPTGNYLATHALARGTYVVHMDGDDYALPGKLQALADYLDANPDCNIAWHRMVILTEGPLATVGMPLAPPRQVFGTDKLGIAQLILAYGATGCHSGSAYRRSARTVEARPGNTLDYFFTISFCEGGAKAGYIDRPLGVYRALMRDVTLTRRPGNLWVNQAKLDHLHEWRRRHPGLRRELAAHAIMVALTLVRTRRPLAGAYLRFFLGCRAIPRVRDIRFIWQTIRHSRTKALRRLLAPPRPEWL